MGKSGSPHILFFPEVFALKNITPFEKESVRNSEIVRDCVKGFILKKQAKPDDLKDKTDFISIMLKDEYFSSNMDLMIDNALTILIAGTDTLNLSTQNLI